VAGLETPVESAYNAFQDTAAFRSRRDKSFRVRNTTVNTMDRSFDQVIASYHRARQSGQLFDTFYRIFLEKSPDIPPLFARTDFPHQKLMLRESILEMLIFKQTESNRAEIERIAERHRQLNVKHAHYELWLDALCESLAKHDPQFTPELERLWREAMGKGIAVMTASVK
jgi:hemoglobin-like flavoprotein